MKKLLPIIIGLILILSMVCVVDAAAEEHTITETTDPQSADTMVVFDIGEAYSVKIPAQIDISVSNGKGAVPMSATVTRLNFGHMLNVTISGTSYVENEVVDTVTYSSWKLDADDSEHYLRYYIDVGGHVDDGVKDTKVSPIKPGDTVLSISAEETYKSVDLHCRTFDYNSVDYSGRYTDTLTFIVSIKDENGNTVNPGAAVTP